MHIALRAIKRLLALQYPLTTRHIVLLLQR